MTTTFGTSKKTKMNGEELSEKTRMFWLSAAATVATEVVLIQIEGLSHSAVDCIEKFIDPHEILRQ